jgi:ABC-type lipoprotein export system ATPase subunit
LIYLDHVSKVYPSARGPVRALDAVTLDVAAGEFVAVRGPSGCGKSTLLALVGALAQPTSGRVVVEGHDLAAMSSAARARFRARRVGFVFQMFHLLPYVNVLENVLAAALPGTAGDVQPRARQLLEQFGLSERLTHRPAELSIGERQRVAMARALLNRPALLLADEPTGNLDADSAVVVLRHLADYHRQGGAVLLVTHDDQAAAFASRTVRMQHGRMIADETS